MERFAISFCTRHLTKQVRVVNKVYHCYCYCHYISGMLYFKPNVVNLRQLIFVKDSKILYLFCQIDCFIGRILHDDDLSNII